jgi:glycosyltransferase involved in cell wall biosynthesis
MVHSALNASNPNAQKRIAVVIPAYCETALLPATVARMPEFVDHIIVIDDGSPDATFEVAHALAERDPRVEVIRMGFNYGVGRAISRGYEYALELGADVVAVMAADNQMDPDDLADVIDPVVSESADYAKGNRLAHPDSYRMPRLRRLGTRLLGKMTGAVCGLRELDDSQCGYTAISARALAHVPLDKLYPRYGYPNDLILRLTELGARIEQPVVRPVYADEQSGLRIPSVILPITAILARGAIRRANNRLRRRPKSLAA